MIPPRLFASRGARMAWLAALVLLALSSLYLARYLARARSLGGGVLILSIDCMRPDHMSCYGCARGTTPALDAIAADGMRFSRCYAQANWTKPSIASLMSGLYVRHHGVTVGYRVLDQQAQATGTSRRIDMTSEAFPMPSDFPVMAEVFRAAGFRTAAFVENHQIDARQGFGRGFAVHEKSRTAAQALGEWLDAQPAQEPVFAFLHLMGPHDPYDSARPGFAAYRARFAERNGSRVDFTKLAYKRDANLSAADIARARSLYDAELAFCDGEHVAPLLARLRRSGRYERMTILVIADHGEELAEHGRFGHGLTLFEETIRVPLLVKLPASARALAPGTVVDEAAELIDLFPTLCELYGLPAPRELDGQSLASLLRGDRAPDADALAISEYANFIPGRVLGASVLVGSMKLITSYHQAAQPRPVLPDGAQDALFDLARDLGEGSDLSGARPEVVRRLHARLASLLGSTPITTRSLDHPVPLPPEERRELEALGYGD